ncbi:unnamed protein product [Albugo candida]|uniref:Mitogen-activated protein kinase n=1 Tax=Albugo candida TaxID=65357 RepID=A0A024GN13_9STRA|nr:unnamed protein product [Albugo candida]|eukprot:CCI48115.1 unnamed protein product [Albugo candida]
MAKERSATPVVHDKGFTINGCVFHVDAKYKPIRAIGKGSYGVVCAVTNIHTKEKLAIKKITPMAGDEWDATHTLREIRLMRCLGAHENVISLVDLDMCEEKDELYMMMELADTDLHRLIQSSCPLSDGHVRVIMFQLLCGIQALHENGVLHRDLKPGNILLNKDCELKITDFGLARMIPKQHANPSNATPMTEYVITRWYRPPELMLAPNGCYNGAIDMWSAGCIFGELLTRKPLFPGNDFMDQLARIFRVVPIPNEGERGYDIDKDAARFLATLPNASSNGLADVCVNTTPHALDLIQNLLQFNPKKRFSVQEALAHPFFQGVVEEWGDIPPLKLSHSIDFSFDQGSLPLSTLRRYICDEVWAFKNQNPASDSLTRDAGLATPALLPRASLSTTQSSVSADDAIQQNDCKVGEGFTIKACHFNVSSNYKPTQVLGEGSYGVVCGAIDVLTNEKVAIKKLTPMAGDEWDAKHTLREIRLMRYFGKHPNANELYMMMEMVDTDLHRLIQSQTKLEEAHIAAIIYQILCGAQVLHENGVLHRDLKPGNVLISKNCSVKITDFGLSRIIPKVPKDLYKEAEKPAKTQHMMTEYVITRWYRPPEIMLAPNGCYDATIDMWSIGCIFAEIILRKPLFPGKDFIDQLTRVFALIPVPSREKLGYNVEGDALKFLHSLPVCASDAFAKTFRGRASSEALSLLRRLLCVNPRRRITAHEALQHPYFRKIRQQLGEPPRYDINERLDFDFEQEKCDLVHLRRLIQKEVGCMLKVGDNSSTEGPNIGLISARASELSHDAEIKLAANSIVDGDDNDKDECQPESVDVDEGVDVATSKGEDLQLSEEDPDLEVIHVQDHSMERLVSDTRAQKLDDDSSDDEQERQSNDSTHTPSIDSQSRWVTSRESNTERRDPLLISTHSTSALNHIGQAFVSGPFSDSELALTKYHKMASNATTHKLQRKMKSKLANHNSVQPENVHDKHETLPKGWVRKTQGKTGRVYFYDTKHKVTSWIHPARSYDEMSSQSTEDSLEQNQEPQVSSHNCNGGGKVGHTTKSMVGALPVEWERRTDPKTGRLYYVNLVSHKVFERLPSSVSASLLKLRNNAKVKKRSTKQKQPSTISLSPQSRMSWQR